MCEAKRDPIWEAWRKEARLNAKGGAARATEDFRLIRPDDDDNPITEAWRKERELHAERERAAARRDPQQMNLLEE